MSGANNDMSAVLGEVFGTTKVASATEEDMLKQAQADFFGGLCREQGINVDDLTDEQIEPLWKVAMEMFSEQQKTAGEMPPQFAKKDGDKDDKGGKPEGKKDDADKEKEAAATRLQLAEAEFNEKRAAATKIAEAVAMGQIMAHSFVEELSKLAGKDGGGFPFPPKNEGKEKDEKEGKDGKDGKEKEASSAEKAAALVNAFQTATKTASPAAGTSTPNFDETAAIRAIELLKEAKVCDDQMAFNRINAVYVLGLPESVKIASVSNVNDALHLRALEFCEAAGFQVAWPQA